jgi:hypothetical protein
MRSFVLAATVIAASALRPGIPPECFDQYSCIFHRNLLGPRGYTWDLINLCASRGNEYKAYPPVPPGQTPPKYPVMEFNICGSVGTAVAPCVDSPNNDCANGVKLPMPHSHGVVIQYINDPAHDDQYPCADVDSCDQATNPNCNITCTNPNNIATCTGSLNYDATRTGTNPYTGALIQHNVGREARCQRDPTFYFCRVQVTHCTDATEILASYDGINADSERYPTSGSPPAFGLNDEEDPNSGIFLTYPSAKAYISDPFACTDLDPMTGEPIERSATISIACDQGVSGLKVFNYTETTQCTYTIYAASKWACGSAGDPFAGALVGQSDIPISHTPTRNFWFSMLGLFIVAPVAYYILSFLDNKGYLDFIKARLPALPAWVPWIGGGGSSSGGGGSACYSSSYKSVGSPAATSSGGAYGSA